MGKADEDEGWLDIGVDLASRLWVNWDVLSNSDFRALSEEQWANPIPGNNRQIRVLEADHPELRRLARR